LSKPGATVVKKILQASLLFRVSLGVGVLGIINMVLFTIWRGHNPPQNPGGPLEIMGPWVVAWEFSRGAIVTLGFFGLYLSIIQCHKQEVTKLP
jgi:hypothetical protein